MWKLILVLLVCAAGCAHDQRSSWVDGGAGALEDAGQEAPDAFLADEDAEDEETYPDAGPEAPDAAQEPEDAAEPVMDAGQESEDASATDAALGLEDAGDAALGPGTQCEVCGKETSRGVFYQTRECVPGYSCYGVFGACIERHGDDLAAPCTNPETSADVAVTPEGLVFWLSQCHPVNMTCEEWLAKYGS